MLGSLAEKAVMIGVSELVSLDNATNSIKKTNMMAKGEEGFLKIKCWWSLGENWNVSGKDTSWN